MFNPNHLNTQHSNIIYQFLKKVSDKVKESPSVAKDALKTFSLFFNKVCKTREDMKQRLEQIAQMERELKAIAQQS